MDLSEPVGNIVGIQSLPIQYFCQPFWSWSMVGDTQIAFNQQHCYQSSTEIYAYIVQYCTVYNVQYNTSFNGERKKSFT